MALLLIPLIITRQLIKSPLVLLIHPHFNVVLVEERLAVLKGRQHYCARWSYFQQPGQDTRE